MRASRDLNISLAQDHSWRQSRFVACHGRHTELDVSTLRSVFLFLVRLAVMLV